MTFKLCLFEIFCILCTSQGVPKTCTPKIAVVFLVILFSILSGSMFMVTGSISQKTGLMFSQDRILGVAGKVKGVVITSPFKSKLLIAVSNAIVPLLNKDT